MLIYATPTLTEDELGVLARIESLRREISLATGGYGNPRKWVGTLRRTLQAKAIQGSNSIEGYRVSIEDAIAAVEEEEPLDEKSEAFLAVANYQSAMTYVLRAAQDRYFAYSTQLIKSLHFMMTQHTPTKNPGLWRPGAIRVENDATGEVVYEAPDVELVPPLMDTFIASLDTDGSTPWLVRAAMAHLNLVMIHPFSDGNGRMARCMQTLVLARTGLVAPVFSSIEEYLGANTPAYYDVLARVGQGAWHPENDARPWVRFCLTAHFRQATTVASRIRVMGELWDRLDGIIATRGLPERTVFALADAAMGYRVRNSTYRSRAEVSNQVASRDLKELVVAKLLIPVGDKRGRHYLGSPELVAMRESLRTRAPIPDPFDEPGPSAPTPRQSTLFPAG